MSDRNIVLCFFLSGLSVVMLAVLFVAVKISEAKNVEPPFGAATYYTYYPESATKEDYPCVYETTETVEWQVYQDGSWSMDIVDTFDEQWSPPMDYDSCVIANPKTAGGNQ